MSMNFFPLLFWLIRWPLRGDSSLRSFSFHQYIYIYFFNFFLSLWYISFFFVCCLLLASVWLLLSVRLIAFVSRWLFFQASIDSNHSGESQASRAAAHRWRGGWARHSNGPPTPSPSIRDRRRLSFKFLSRFISATFIATFYIDFSSFSSLTINEFKFLVEVSAELTEI